MVVFSVSIGFSDWVYPDNSGDVTTGNGQPTQSKEIPVAYLLSDPTRKYSKVEDAINKANLSSGKEVVVPILTAKNATIAKNVTIKSNVTLNIPYEVNAEGTPTENAAKASVQDGSTFVSNSSAVFTLNIAPNVTLTNYGTIEIGGVLGSGGGGANAKSATIERKADLYDVHSMLSENDLNSFINTEYMIENFTAYTDGTSSTPLTINTGNSVFLSEFVFSDIKVTKTLYIKVNCVKYREITIKYRSEWKGLDRNYYKFTETIKYSLNDISRLYRLKTTGELSFNLNPYVWDDYVFKNYELYPGVDSKTGTPAMTIDEEGTTVDLNSEQLKSAWDNRCMFVYVNRK